MKCETCKWWGHGKFAYETPYDNAMAKTCGKIKMLNWMNKDNPDAPVEYTYKKDKNGNTIHDKEYMHHKAYCVDGSSYRAELVTREDFGCVLWEI